MPAPDFDALDAARARVGDRLGALSPEARAWSPAPDTWSALQVLDHLLKVEQSMLWGLSRQVSRGADRRDLGPRDPDKLALVDSVLRSPRPFRMPAAVERFISPDPQPDYAALREAWAEIGAQTRALLGTVPEALREAGLIGHPIAGPLGVDDLVPFLEAHVVHHEHQLDRLDAARADAQRSG